MSVIRNLLASQGSLFVINVLFAVTAILALTSFLALYLRRQPTNVYATCLAGLFTAVLVPVPVALCGWFSVRIVGLSVESLTNASWQETAVSESHGISTSEQNDGRRPSIRVTDSSKAPGSKSANLFAPDATTGMAEMLSATKNNTPDSSGSARRSHADQASHFIALLVAFVWVAGMLFKLAKVAHGVCVVSGLRRESRPLPWNQFPGLEQQVRVAIDRPSVPTVLECKDLNVPIAVGVIRPTVLLPVGMTSQLSQSELRDVLVHECGHVVRKDNFTAWLQILAEAGFWFHPLVYVVNRMLSRACEQLCDNFVIRQGDRERFAQLLLTLTTRLSRTPTAAWTIVGYPWKLEHRIGGLLDTRRSTATQVGWTRGIGVTSAFLMLGTFVGGSGFHGAEPSELSATAHDDDLAAFPPAGEAGNARDANVKVERLDSRGDALPDGAAARLGTIRLHHDSSAAAVAFSTGDKPVLASSSSFGDIRLWDIGTGNQLHLLQRDSYAVRALQFSPDGRQLASGNDVGQLKFWDATTGKLLHELLADKRDDGIASIAFSAYGKWIAAGVRNSRTVRVWPIPVVAPPRMLTDAGGDTITFSPDGRKLASASNGPGSPISIWNLDMDEPPIVIGIPIPDRIVSLEFIDGGTRLLSGEIRYLDRRKIDIAAGDIGYRYELRVWDPGTGKAIDGLLDPTRQAGATLALSADGKVLASASNQEIIMWDMHDLRPVRRFSGSFNILGSVDRGLAVSGDGNLLAVATGWDTAVSLWNLTTGARLHPQLEPHQKAVSALAFQSQGKQIVTVSDGIIRKWSVEDERLLFASDPDGDWYRGNHFSNDGTMLVKLSTRRVLSLDNNVGVLQVWDMQACRRVIEDTLEGEPMLAAISNDKQFVAVATTGSRIDDPNDPFGYPPTKSTNRSTIGIWRLDTGTRFKDIPAPELPLVALWFSDGGHALSYVDSQGHLRTWDHRALGQVRSAKADIQVAGMQSPYKRRRNALSANRKLLAINMGQRENDVRLVDLVDGTTATTVSMPQEFPHVLALSHDNQLVATACVQITNATSRTDYSIRLWDATSGMQLATVGIPDSAVSSMAFSPDGAWLATGTDMGTALVWNVRMALKKATLK